MPKKKQIFHHINDRKKLRKLDRFLANRLRKGKDLLSIDTETTGLDYFRNVVIGFSLAATSTQGFYVPFLEWQADRSQPKQRKKDGVEFTCYPEGKLVDPWTKAEYDENVTPKEYRPQQFLIDFLAKWVPQFRLVLQNAPFDYCMLKSSTGVDISPYIYVDTALLHHVIDENSSHALKEIAISWKDRLGFDPEEDANSEQLRLGRSVLINGGSWTASSKTIHRGDPILVSEYAAKDTMLTIGVHHAGKKEFREQFSHTTKKNKSFEDYWNWFIKDEVMPLCREVVTEMKYRGVYIDVKYFETLRDELNPLMNKLEDDAVAGIAEAVGEITVGQSLDEAVSTQRLIKKIIDIEGLSIPTKLDKKSGIHKPTLAKGEVKKRYQEEPHWVWGYILGEDELRYSPERMEEIKRECYIEATGHRHRFNIGSRDQLVWLFCEKLGADPRSLPQTKGATKTAPKPQMNEEVLSHHFLKKHKKFVKPILLYKKLAKLMSTYILPALNLNQDGWLYVDMKQNGTISGRFSCGGGFNLQTLPRVESIGACTKCESEETKVIKLNRFLTEVRCKNSECKAREILTNPSVIKAGFIAPPGYKIVNADFSSLEPRCFAFESGDQKLKDVYQKDLDLYSKVYCDIMDRKQQFSADPKAPNFLKKAAPDKRTQVKPVVLGIPYGARDTQVAHLMGFKKTEVRRDRKGKEKMVEVPDVTRGKEFREQYLDTYKDLTKYMRKCERLAIKQGYVETLVGRRRHFRNVQLIHTLLEHVGLSKDDFLDAKYSVLENNPDRYGLQHAYLEEFAEVTGMDSKWIFAKGGWAYLRTLYKNELNNAKNFRIQGLAAHITNKAMLETHRRLKKFNIDAYICLQVHDEITMYAREEHAERAAKILRKSMETNSYARLLDIPMQAEPVICENLSSAK